MVETRIGGEDKIGATAKTGVGAEEDKTGTAEMTEARAKVRTEAEGFVVVEAKSCPS